MSVIKVCLFLLIISIAVIDGRALRRRRQAAPNTFGQDVNNYMSYGFNTVRDNVVPAIGSTVDRFSQNWNQYKQNFNQGMNQMGQNWDQYKDNFNQGINQIGQNWDQYKQNFNQGMNQIGQTWDQYKDNLNQGVNQFSQGWNQFRQNFNPQYPYNNNNNNYRYNQYDYNNQQNPYPMNYNYPSNTYQNYGGSQGNQYPPNNYYNGYGAARANMPYYASNTGGQPNQNFGGQQQRFKRALVPNTAVNINKRAGPRRR